MTLVADASVVVAALTDSGPDGAWAEAVLLDGPLLAPHLMPVEVLSVLRRVSSAGALDPVTAAVAVGDLDRLRVELFPLAPFAERVWDLRRNVTPYDAWYVALAEAAGAPLATLDVRLAGAPGPRCAVRVPPA